VLRPEPRPSEQALRLLAFGALALPELVLWFPIVPVVFMAFATYFFWIPVKAGVVADLLETVFDLHRSALYKQLRWPLPCNPQEERASGLRLTEYVARGSDDPYPDFTDH
jgi:hypothetical protein